jgi:hypothetical protein
MSQNIIVKARQGLYTEETHCIKIMGDNKSYGFLGYTTAELRNERKPPIRDGTQGHHLNWRLSPCFGPILPNRGEMTLNWC